MLMDLSGPPNNTAKIFANTATQGKAKLIPWAPDASTHSPHTEGRKGQSSNFYPQRKKLYCTGNKSAHSKGIQLNIFDLEKLDKNF